MFFILFCKEIPLEETSNQTKSKDNTSDSDSLNLNFSEAELQRLKKKKTADFSSNIYKNVLKKGFLIENLSLETHKVYTDVSSNMTLSFTSDNSPIDETSFSMKKSSDSKQISSENSPILEDFSVKKSSKPVNLSKFAKNPIEFESFEWKKPIEIRRIIYRRDPKRTRKVYRNSVNKKKRRKSFQENEEKSNEINNKYALEDFDRVKRFSKKERERFQNHIQYLKSVKKITEYKSLSRVFMYIINTLRIIAKNEILSKSKRFFSSLLLSFFFKKFILFSFKLLLNFFKFPLNFL